MELLNLSFAILILKLSFSVLPIVLGSYLLLASDEVKREIRSFICRSLFNVNNAIPMRDLIASFIGLAAWGCFLVSWLAGFWC